MADMIKDRWEECQACDGDQKKRYEDEAVLGKRYKLECDHINSFMIG